MSDIFNDEPIVPDDGEIEVSLDTLVGETQKYKTPDELAKAYVHADAAILRAKARIAELEASDKVKTDLLEAQLKGKNPPEERKEPANEHREVPVPPKVETKDISELVREELNNANEQRRKADNTNRAAETMVNHYGSLAKAQEAIKQRANELGVSSDWLRDSAANSPAAFFATMGINPAARSNNTPSYSNEVVLDRHSGASKNGFKAYEEIRKANPKLYYSPEIQKQMFNSMRELGDNFFKS